MTQHSFYSQSHVTDLLIHSPIKFSFYCISAVQGSTVQYNSTAQYISTTQKCCSNWPRNILICTFLFGTLYPFEITWHDSPLQFFVTLKWFTQTLCYLPSHDSLGLSDTLTWYTTSTINTRSHDSKIKNTILPLYDSYLSNKPFTRCISLKIVFSDYTMI